MIVAVAAHCVGLEIVGNRLAAELAEGLGDEWHHCPVAPCEGHLSGHALYRAILIITSAVVPALRLVGGVHEGDRTIDAGDRPRDPTPKLSAVRQLRL